MMSSNEPLLALTAGDVMKAPVEVIPEWMSLQAAARKLSSAQVSGAPVVNAAGACVGVLSAIDFLRWARSQPDTSERLPRTCSYWVREQTPEGKTIYRCQLPEGSCPLQVKQQGANGEKFLACLMPHCVMEDWQQVDLDDVPTEEVSRYMTPETVTVLASTPIADLARMMVDAHIHRLIVVDDRGRPLGIVSSTDLLATLASSQLSAPVGAAQA